MRCLSPHARYSIQVIEGKEQIVVDQRGAAQSLVLSEPMIANFQQSGLHEWEIEAALERFSFSGIPDGVNPLTRISVFDTESFVFAREWPDEDEHGNSEMRDDLLRRIDQRLRKLQAFHPSEFIIVEKPAADKPWGSYDDDSVEDIIAFQKRLQIDPTFVRLYEHENQGRVEVIRAMEAVEHGLDPNAVPASQYLAGVTVDA